MQSGKTNPGSRAENQLPTEVLICGHKWPRIGERRKFENVFPPEIYTSAAQPVNEEFFLLCKVRLTMSDQLPNRTFGNARQNGPTAEFDV